MDAAGNIYGTTSGTAFVLVPEGPKKWKYHVIYRFCSRKDCADGTNPDSGLIIDTAGNLYGTTLLGGKADGGVVFELPSNPNGTKRTLKVLYNLCLQSTDPCSGGFTPEIPLTYAGAATGTPYDGVSPLYSASNSGGDHGRGAIFALTPSGSKWQVDVLYSFCSQNNCADGADPTSLIIDGAGNKFGTTESGGASDNAGVVFELGAGQRGPMGTETTLYNFCSMPGCADGSTPNALVVDSAVQLIGTTLEGGAFNAGAIFKLSPGTDWQESVAYSFCQQGGCPDGMYPAGGLILDSSGNLFGTALFGGYSNCFSGSTCGTVFELSGKRLSVIHKFCSAENCSDGANPNGIIMDTSGNLFGTTQVGGAIGTGNVFEVVR